MTKILIQPYNLKHLKYLNDKDISGYIIGLKNYAIFQELKLDVNEIKRINTDKDLYISINKPIHNDNIDDVKANLIELSKLNIKGILFDDLAIYQINKDLKLNLKLIWHQLHLPTNATTCNYWYQKGVNGVLLSTEIQLSDFISIKKNTKMMVMVYLYGHLPIFESSRTLITNYLAHINKSKKDGIYYLYEKERDKYYPIYEEYDNTFILDDILNGVNELPALIENDIDYIILNSLNINEKIFNATLDKYINILKGKKTKKENTYTGFLHQESIFKVKE